MLPSDVIFAVGELPSLGYVGKVVKMSQTPPALPPAPLPVLAEDGEREGGVWLPPPSILPLLPAHLQMSPAAAAGPFVPRCEQMSETPRRM